MKVYSLSKGQMLILAGDFFVLALAVIVGLAFHDLSAQITERFALTFLPWALAWFLFAPLFDLFNSNEIGVREIGLIFWAMLLASPFAATLRAFWLDGSVIPLFALIMGLVAATGISVKRVLSKILAKAFSYG